ncbi:MAG: VCBS repeat-containing protein [Myxococcales bacterium]|nr:MAG: VCBS repeat-containing protein [Myxococcales bacterium]
MKRFVISAIVLFFVSVNARAQFIDSTAVQTAFSVLNDSSGNFDDMGYAVVWADFNNDGFLDLVVNQQNESRLFFFNPISTLFEDMTNPKISNGSNGFLRNNGNAFGKWRSAIAADFNHDGFVDIARNWFEQIEVYLNNGSADAEPYSFGGVSRAPNLTISSGTTATFNSEGMGVLDYDGDGDLDLLFDNDDAFELLLNDGNASFSYLTSAPFHGSGGNDGHFIAVTDYDANGFVDILVDISSIADLWSQTSPSTFASVANYTQEGDTGGDIFCDFNADGRFDLFAVNGSDSLIYFQDNLGTLNVSTQPSGATGYQYGGVDCGDVDSDGDLDLLVVNNGAHQLFINDGSGAMSSSSLPVTANGLGSGATFADVDQDGDVDLLINQNPAAVFLENTSSISEDYLIVRVQADSEDACQQTNSDGFVLRDDIGATIRLLDNANPNNPSYVGPIQEVNGGKGAGSQSSPWVHFGLTHLGGGDHSYLVEIKFRYQQGDSALDTVRIPVHPSDIAGYQQLNVISSDPDGDSIKTGDEKADAAAAGLSDDIDGDGLANWLDTDADGDGVSDRSEAGDSNACTSAVDSDGDGVPDYLVSSSDPNVDPPPLGTGDSDGDGLLDSEEDLNGNGNPDDDDSDRDGIPNYLDVDDDDDGILTSQEITDAAAYGGRTDVDGDGLVNWLDTDSDGDGILDSDESGDADGDGVPDYLSFSGVSGGALCSIESRQKESWLFVVVALAFLIRKRKLQLRDGT